MGETYHMFSATGPNNEVLVVCVRPEVLADSGGPEDFFPHSAQDIQDNGQVTVSGAPGAVILLPDYFDVVG